MFIYIHIVRIQVDLKGKFFVNNFLTLSSHHQSKIECTLLIPVVFVGMPAAMTTQWVYGSQTAWEN